MAAHESRPHFGNPRTRRILGHCFKNHTCERRLTIECLKLIQILKTTFKSSCYCHVSWDTLYIFARHSYRS